MPTVEQAPKQDDIVIELATGRTSKNEVVRAAGYTVKGRWVEKRTQTVTPDGTPVSIDITVRVDADVPIDSLMTCRGVAGRVTYCTRVKDIKGTLLYREYYLSRI